MEGFGLCTKGNVVSGEISCVRIASAFNIIVFM